MQRGLMTVWLVVIALPLSAAAADYALVSQTLDTGGGRVAGGTYELHGTIGQPDAGYCAGQTYALTSGFWRPWTAPPTCSGDVSEDGIVDLTDLAIVLSQFGEAGAGLPGDVDNNGVIDMEDVTLVLMHFGAGC